MRYLLTCCLFMASLSLLFAQGWIRKFPQDTADVKDAIKLSDNSYALASYQPSYNNTLNLLKISAKGDFISNKSFNNIPFEQPTVNSGTYKKIKFLNSPDGDLFIVIEILDGTIIFKTDVNFNLKWQKKLNYKHPSAKIHNNYILFIGNEPSTLTKSTMIELDLEGNKISETLLDNGIIDFEISNESIFALGYNPALIIMDFTGKVIRINQQVNYNQTSKTNLLKLSDSTFLVNFEKVPEAYGFDNKLNLLFSTEIKVSDISTLKNEGFITVSTIGSVFDTISQKVTEFCKYNIKGELVTKVSIIDSIEKKLIYGIIPVEDNNFLYYGTSFGTREYWGGAQTFAVKINSLGKLFPKTITGFLRVDADKNCVVNAPDKGISNIMLTATNNVGDVYRGITNSKGFFEIDLINGVYTIQPDIKSLSKYWSNCTPSVSATVADGKQPDTLQFPIKSLISAPLMQVDITTPFLRRCFNNTYYVQYCNKGTNQAQNAFVDITLDSLLEYQSATLPLKGKTGNIYRFNIGNVEINDCGKFEIVARVRCGDSTRLNQTLCVKAKIYPDTTGAPTTNWSGANITIKGGCIGDSAVFIIKNEGTAASKVLKAKTYINEDVYEGFNVQLPAQGVMTKKYKSNNKTWRVTSEQEPNHPNSTRPTIFVEPCSNEPILTLQSPALAFSSDDYALSIDEDCQPIRGAYDPNDKAGYPFGKKGIGQIPENQDIEYTIRFQNTGTDTAFTVVIKDTLPTVLDASSIEWGASSHPYTPSFEDKSTAIFTFKNILLVDSFTNEPKSHGFVRFRIKQMPNLLKGTKIQNSAGIYFDFNPPIITNKTLHTIGADEFLSPVIETTELNASNVKVSPNPFSDKTHFKLENPLLYRAELEIFDLNGRLLRTEIVKSQEFDFNKNNLKSGIYIFKITENGQIIGQGKIAVQ